MTKRIVINEPLVGRALSEIIKHPYNPDAESSIGVVDDSYDPSNPAWVRGGVLYTCYTGASLWMHMAGRDERWATRDFLWAAFHYPFVQLGCGRVYGCVEAANTVALDIDLRLGFSVVATFPGMFASGAGLIVCMEREACRWLAWKPRTIVSNV